jgi:rhomboid protease GluP
LAAVNSSADPSGFAAEPTAVAIPSRSERQAMDWGLALASQGIEAVIEGDPVAGGWRLVVPESEASRAGDVIRQYRRENRRFAWRRELPGGSFVFHHAAFGWVAMLAAIFVFQPWIVDAGRFDTATVRQGEWWRAFTAIWLHADIAHLASNTITGGLAVGLAMGRFGAGTALFLTLLAGAAANFFAMNVRGAAYSGLGASGVVMAALGMLAGYAVIWWRVSRYATKPVLISVGAGVLLFLVIGIDPSSDVLAHLGGFVSGLVFGALAAWAGWSRYNRPFAIAYAVLSVAVWAAALVRHGSF